MLPVNEFVERALRRVDIPFEDGKMAAEPLHEDRTNRRTRNLGLRRAMRQVRR